MQQTWASVRQLTQILYDLNIFFTNAMISHGIYIGQYIATSNI